MEAALLALGLLSTTALTGAVAVAVYRRNQRRIALWRRIAAERGGIFYDAHGFWNKQYEGFEVDIGDVRVVLDRMVVGSGQHRTTFTRCRARYPIPAGPEFRVSPQGVLGSVAKALGARDVILGADTGFDQRYVVKADDPERVGAVWSWRAMRLMYERFPGGVCESDGDRVILRQIGALDDRRRVEAALDVVGELAGADLFGLGALRAIPGAHYHAPRGPWNDRTTPHAVLEVPSRIVIEPVPTPRGETASTRAHVAGGPEEPLVVHVDERGEATGDVYLLPTNVSGSLKRIGAGTLLASHEASSFTWDAIETDPDRLAAGANLLGALTAPAARGVYR